jgi:integrase
LESIVTTSSNGANKGNSGRNGLLILEGEAYLNFIKTLRSEYTKKTYAPALAAYIKYKNFTNLVQLLNDDIKHIQSNVIDYILYLKEVRRLSSQTLLITSAALKHFYDMNDVLLNWKKINRFIGSLVRTVKDRAYTKLEIRQMLEKCDERKKVMILLQMSAGLRVGALPDLEIKHLTKLDNYKTYKLIVYDGTPDEYCCFCTPECRTAIDNYLEYRQRSGEKLRPESPLIREQFDKTNPFMPKARHVSKDTISKSIRQVLVDAGIRTRPITSSANNDSNNRKSKRYDVMVDHGFRKFYDTTMTNAGVSPLYIELLEGHRIRGVKDSYFKPIDVDLLEGNDKMRGYISAVDDLTIDDSHRLQRQVSELKKEGDQIQRLRQEKDSEMQTMKQKYEEMSSTLQNILTVISNLEQPVDKNKIAQELILKGNYKPDL